MIFRLDSSNENYATVEFETSNAADSAIISRNDSDGDGIPTWADAFPDDSTNGASYQGYTLTKHIMRKAKLTLIRQPIPEH